MLKRLLELSWAVSLPSHMPLKNRCSSFGTVLCDYCTVSEKIERRGALLSPFVEVACKTIRVVHEVPVVELPAKASG